MSPGGLVSLAAGVGVEEPPPPPHPATTRTASAAARVMIVRMAATVPRTRERLVRPTSTRGQTFPEPCVARRTLTTMTAPGILLVEDDEAIASGLARVLDSQGHAVRRLSRGRPALESAGEDVGL